MDLRNLIRRIKGKYYYYFRYSSQDKRDVISVHPGFAEASRNFQYNYIRNQGLNRGDSFLDFGCGTLVTGILLIDYLNEGHYTGIDVREIAIREATKEVAAKGLEHKQPKLILSQDLDQLELNVHFDMIWAFLVFDLMSDEQQGNFFSFAKNHLAPEGKLYLSSKAGSQPTRNKWQGFSQNLKPMGSIEKMTEEYGLHAKNEGNLIDLGYERMQRLKHAHFLFKITNT